MLPSPFGLLVVFLVFAILPIPFKVKICKKSVSAYIGSHRTPLPPYGCVFDCLTIDYMSLLNLIRLHHIIDGLASQCLLLLSISSLYSQTLVFTYIAGPCGAYLVLVYHDGLDMSNPYFKWYTRVRVSLVTGILV